MIYRSKKLGNNPYPCREHETRIEGLHTKIGKVDEKLDKACERISKVEGRLNGLK